MNPPAPAIRVAVLRRAVPERLWTNFAAAAETTDLTVVETGPAPAVPGDPPRFRLLRRPAPDVPALHRILDDLDPEVLLCFGWADVPSLASLTWAQKHRRRTIVTSDSNLHDWRRSLLREGIKAQLLRGFDLAWAAGQSAAAYLMGLGFPAERIAVGGLDTVDLSHFEQGAQAARAQGAANRTALGLPQRYFLCCGRLAPEKNHATLLEAFALYRDGAGPEAWDLVLVGSGPLETVLREQVRSLGLGGHVQFRGQIGYQDLPVYYGLASALVLPSRRETWAVVVNEAAAAHLPLLVSDRAGSALELVEPGANGFHLDPAAPRSVADAMCRLAHAGLDLAAMGRRSRELVEPHGAQTYGATLGALARRALDLPPRPHGSLARLVSAVLLHRELARARRASA